MEFCPKDLYADKKDGKVFSEKEAAIIIEQCLLAMVHYHSRNLVHRDIKPENIMFGRDGKVRLCDFGVSQSVREKDFETLECGTIYYMAPEVFDNHYNKQCDVWSLGVTLFQMVTGRLPFTMKDGRGYMMKNIKKAKFRMPKSFSDSLKSFINGMLVVDYEERMTPEQCLNHKWI